VADCGSATLLIGYSITLMHDADILVAAAIMRTNFAPRLSVAIGSESAGICHDSVARATGGWHKVPSAPSCAEGPIR